MGLAGATGIFGTVLFTYLRSRLGLERTGLIAYTVDVSCLVLAVASVWAPGSPFDIHYSTAATSGPPANQVVCNSSSVDLNETATTRCVDDPLDVVTGAANVSVVLLLVGIILSRVGQSLSPLLQSVLAFPRTHTHTHTQ